MAPPPEYDKEPKAPDKSATTISCEETKTLHNLVNDQLSNSDAKPASTAASGEVENNKHVETLDDGQLRALLDEAITYKCPKDREGKSSLFKELLEEVEQDEQACEAAARGLSGGARARAGGGGSSRAMTGRGRRALPHSNSLQDLVAAALAAEPAPRRHRPAPPVSARAIHGGSLPSGVDTSFLLSEEPPRGANYLATVRCVNPPPLAERRVSASDANCVAEVELLNRRSKPAFPMTYTARATLEIGSGAVCSGRAVTTTTASNQVRTAPSAPRRRPRRPLCGPPERLFNYNQLYRPNKYAPPGYYAPQPNLRQKYPKTCKSYPNRGILKLNTPTRAKDCDVESETLNDRRDIEDHSPGPSQSVELEQKIDPKQYKLMSALFPKESCDFNDGGGRKASNLGEIGQNEPRGPLDAQRTDKDNECNINKKQEVVKSVQTSKNKTAKTIPETKTNVSSVKQDVEQQKNRKLRTDQNKTQRLESNENSSSAPCEQQIPRQENFSSDVWNHSVNSWYDSINSQYSPNNRYSQQDNIYNSYLRSNPEPRSTDKRTFRLRKDTGQKIYKQQFSNTSSSHDYYWQQLYPSSCDSYESSPLDINLNYDLKERNESPKYFPPNVQMYNEGPPLRWVPNTHGIEKITGSSHNLQRSRKEYRERVGYIKPIKPEYNPRNIRSMTIGNPLPDFDKMDECLDTLVADNNVGTTSTESNDHNTLTVDKPLRQDQDVLSSSIGNLKVGDIIEESKEEISFNETVRSSTPVSESNETEEHQDNTVCKGESSIDIKCENENHSQGQDFSEVEKSGVEDISVKGNTDIQNDSISFDVDNGNLRDFSAYSGNHGDDGTELLKLQKHEERCPDLTYIHNTVKPSDENNHLEPVELTKTVYTNETEEYLTILDNCDEKYIELKTFKTNSKVVYTENASEKMSMEFKNMSNSLSDVPFDNENCVELADLSRHEGSKNESKENLKILVDCQDTFAKYLADQEKLLKVLEDSNFVDTQEHSLVSTLGNSEEVHIARNQTISVGKIVEISEENSNCGVDDNGLTIEESSSSVVAGPLEEVMRIDEAAVESVSGVQKLLAELPNNAYVFLTLPQRLLSHIHSNTEQLPIKSKPKHKKKKDVVLDSAKKHEVTDKRALKALLFENLVKSDSADKSISKGLSTIFENEVDSAIPFSCITTPEVVASCNTTSSTSQSAVAVDPKPLQLGSSYRAVTSLTGELAVPYIAEAPEAPVAPETPAASDQPRSVISSSFNGLSRPNYGSTASTTQEEFKKSLDENGNSVQGYSSPLSGSSQHKKLRRKKSSKNETVIKSHQIDGYQGNKDLNEVLRFIESNADNTRAHKLGRAKHKDDSDDKGGKKRSTERRKEKENKIKRATSMEELSRTKLEDLTDKPKKERWADGAPKAERRSWGDDNRESFYYDEATPDADFQTVTKKRKPRRRTDETGGETCGEAGGEAVGGAGGRGLSPRARRVSAPPSERSNDSNDDMDSVHSLPADTPPARAAAPPPAPPPAPVSYADIARTRHNIPDLIESCNFYAEGDGVVLSTEAAAPAAMDADGYPALEPRQPRRPPPRDHKPAPPPAPATAPARTHRKDRTETAGGAECPAPDVVADRRPPVILLDSAARPRDMDGVTFGFDINEQLLGGPTRRPRCDLVRDAMEGATVVPGDTNGAPEPPPAPPAAVGAAGGAVSGGVTVGGCALRYVAPAPPPDTHHLHQIIDYVGAAWEDVVRCGGGKVRYFSE